MGSDWRLNVLDLGYEHYTPGFFGEVRLIARLVVPVGPYLYVASVVPGNRVWLLQDISPGGVFAPFDLGPPTVLNPHMPYGFDVFGT